MRELIPIGIVGAGRTRDGLGPFLAKFFEEEGFVVAGVSGRSFDRAAANAETLGQQLGHDVIAFDSAAALCAAEIGAAVIACPVQFHLQALQAAVHAGLPTLCEKPLVHEHQVERGAEVVETFGRNRIPLVENCQWPYMLSAFFQLHGAIEPAEYLRVEMGLAPPRGGREMIQNTASHLLSVIQSVASVDSNAVVSDVSVTDSCSGNNHSIFRFRLTAPAKTVEAALHLQVCPAPPRPAWLAINGRRMDRRVGPGYSIHFSADGREVTIEDPTRKVVKHFGQLVRTGDSGLIDREQDRIGQRLQWYRQILNQLK